MPSTVQEWRPTEASIGMPLIDQVFEITETNPQDQFPGFPMWGTRLRAQSPTYGAGEFIWLKGVASCAAGSWVTFNADDHSTALLAANAIGPVAIAMGACVANYGGWFQIYGKGVGKALASYADNGLVFATATAGSIDDAVVAGDRVKNAKGASAVDTPSTGLAEFELQYPFMDDATAA